MNADSLGYINSLINNLFTEKGIVKIIKKNYDIGITKDNFNQIRIADSDQYIYEYSLRKIVDAYAPFLGIIRRIINERNLDVNVVLDEAGVYSLNRSTFISYVETGAAISNELPIQTEKEYNIDRITEDIVNILFYLADMHKVFIFLSEANQMCDSSIRVFERLIDTDNDNLRILMFINDMGTVREYVKNDFNKLMSRFERKGLINEWPFEVLEEEKNIDTYYILTGDSSELDKINNMFFTYAWDQASYYLGMIYQKVEVDNVKVSEQYRYDLLLLYMRISVYNGRCSQTLNLVEKFSKTDFEFQPEEKEYFCTYYKSMAYMYSGNEKDSIDNANRCLEIAKELGDEKKIFNAELLVNMSYLRGWNDVWLCDNKMAVSDEFINNAIKYGYINHLAHVYIYCYDNEPALYAKVEGIEERIPTVTKGIELAKEIGNDACLIEAYRKNVMIASFNGYFEVTNYFYKKIISIARKIGNRIEEANMYNGIGYVSTAYDEFLESNRYYNMALRIYYEEKSNDYIIETIYNIGMNAVMAGDYDHAVEYFSVVLNMLAQLKKDRVRVCNLSKILGLQALSYYKKGNIYYSQMYINKAKNFLDSVHVIGEDFDQLPLWDDDLFLYYLLSASLCYEKKDYVNALINFEKAEIYMNRSVGSRFFNYLQFVLEKSRTGYHIAVKTDVDHIDPVTVI